MAIIDCPKCSNPYFDDGACGCGICEKCGWQEICVANRDGHYGGDHGEHVRYCDQFSIDVFSNDHWKVNTVDLNDMKSRVYNWLNKHPNMDAEDVSKYFRISGKEAVTIVEELLLEGLLDFVGDN
jgi:hypothetical protein